MSCSAKVPPRKGDSSGARRRNKCRSFNVLLVCAWRTMPYRTPRNVGARRTRGKSASKSPTRHRSTNVGLRRKASPGSLHGRAVNKRSPRSTPRRKKQKAPARQHNQWKTRPFYEECPEHQRTENAPYVAAVHGGSRVRQGKRNRGGGGEEHTTRTNGGTGV